MIFFHPVGTVRSTRNIISFNVLVTRITLSRRSTSPDKTLCAYIVPFSRYLTDTTTRRFESTACEDVRQRTHTSYPPPNSGVTGLVERNVINTLTAVIVRVKFRTLRRIAAASAAFKISKAALTNREVLGEPTYYSSQTQSLQDTQRRPACSLSPITLFKVTQSRPEPRARSVRVLYLARRPEPFSRENQLDLLFVPRRVDVTTSRVSTIIHSYRFRRTVTLTLFRRSRVSRRDVNTEEI